MRPPSSSRPLRPLPWEDGDRLHIDRAALREQVGATAMSGLVGTLSCDPFGDCGTGRMNIYHHTDRSVTDVSKLLVVYVYSPPSR